MPVYPSHSKTAMNPFRVATSVLVVLFSTGAQARDIRVGTDCTTIAEAIKAAGPGDTVHLEPKVYREYAGFYSKKGLPGQPITLDGHGATLEGADPLDPQQWREVSPGLFAADNLMARLDDAMLGRWFFRFAGRMIHMGRTSKGKSAPFKKPEELSPGEWTFEKDAARALPNNPQVFGTFFIRLKSGESLADAQIEVPVRSGGVQMGGNNAHLVIRNITATHPYNDGFNIHGDCRDVVFENIRAIECGDDGISAHESAQYQVRGFVSIGNSTGICDTGTSETSYDGVLIRDCIGHDLFFPATGRYMVKNALIISSAQQALTVSKSGPQQSCFVQLENVWMIRQGELKEAIIGPDTTLEAKNCTFENMRFRNSGMQNFYECLVGDQSQAQGTSSGADQASLKRRIDVEKAAVLCPEPPR